MQIVDRKGKTKGVQYVKIFLFPGVLPLQKMLSRRE